MNFKDNEGGSSSYGLAESCNNGGFSPLGLRFVGICKPPEDERTPEEIRKLAETYRPNIESLADKLAQGPLAEYFSPAQKSAADLRANENQAKLHAMMNKSHDLAAQAMKLADEAIARMMRK